MNVLLITFSFPPAGGVGVLRALSFAKYFPENGVRVDVLTARNAPSVGKDLSLLAQVPPEVTVHRSWTLDLPFTLRKAIKKMLTRGKAAGGAAADGKQANVQSSGGGGNRWKRFVANLLLPDPQVGWLPFAFPAARRIIRRRKIDVVLITVPPFSTVRLVTKLRRVFPKLPIVIDFRDEWLTTTINLVSFNNNQRARAVAQKAESEAVRDATGVVAVTEAARRELMERYPEDRPEKFWCLPNGFDTKRDGVAAAASTVGPKIPGDGETILLTYIGTVYGSTDPTTLVEAVLALPSEVRARLKLRFIGHIETSSYRQTLERLGDTIELKGFIPQADALRTIEATDYLLLVTHDRINVAAKFYDYLGGGKPILAAVHPEGDVRKLLEETGAGRWADVRDVTAVRELLLSVLTVNGTQTAAPMRDADKIALFHRRALARRYAEALTGLVGR